MINFILLLLLVTLILAPKIIGALTILILLGILWRERRMRRYERETEARVAERVRTMRRMNPRDRDEALEELDREVRTR